jgi:hypothetical protein
MKIGSQFRFCCPKSVPSFDCVGVQSRTRVHKYLVKDDDFHKLETIPEFMSVFPPFLPSTHHFGKKKVYYDDKKRDLNRILIYECRFDESQKPKPEESTRLERFESVMSECVI